MALLREQLRSSCCYSVGSRTDDAKADSTSTAKDAKDDAKSDANDDGDNDGDDEYRESVSLDDVRRISQLWAQLSDDEKTKAATASKPHAGYVHELLQGSAVHVPAPAAPQLTREQLAFKKKLARLRVQHENREYDRLLGRGDAASEPFRFVPAANASQSARHKARIGDSDGTMLQQVGIGLNMIVFMITGFVLFWFIGKQYFPAGDLVSPVLCGVLGLVGAMLVEISLYILREEKIAIGIKKYNAAAELKSQ
jgi:hypothetical protein